MIPFSPPFISKEVIDEVVDSLESGWITTGPKVRNLEAKIAEINHLDNVLCVNSWTSAAILALTWFGLDKDDEVIIPAYTYSATALAVIHAGAKVVMVDVGDDFNISIEAIRKAITPNTKVIIPVDFAGYPADYNNILSLVKSKEVLEIYNPKNDLQKSLGRILIMADAAHSFGAHYYNNDKRCNADIISYSLHAVKNITSAEGGALGINLPKPFNNTDVKNEMKLMSLNCQTKDAFAKAIAGNWKYDIVGLGLKINMPDVNAAIALGQLKDYEFIYSRRKEIFKKYTKEFSKYDWLVLPLSKKENEESSYHLYPIRIPSLTEDKRDLLIQLISKKEIAVNVHFIPLPMLTYFKGLGFAIKDFPVAYKNYSTEISLPLYPQLSDIDISTIIKGVVDAFHELTT